MHLHLLLVRDSQLRQVLPLAVAEAVENDAVQLQRVVRAQIALDGT